MELYTKLFGEAFLEAHNASADVEATARCFLELVRIEVIPYDKVGLTYDDFENYKKLNPEPFKLIGLSIEPHKSIVSTKNDEGSKEDKHIEDTSSSINSFAHLHVHSQFSVLQATTDIVSLVDKAVEMNMPAVGLTDHSNMFGAYKFITTVLNHPINNSEDSKQLALKPVLGCELNVCKQHTDKSTKDYGYQVPFLCKNKKWIS